MENHYTIPEGPFNRMGTIIITDTYLVSTTLKVEAKRDDRTAKRNA